MDPTHQPFRLYAEVIVNANINKILDYGIPAELENLVTVGSVVKVPLQRKLTNDKYKIAIVLKIKSSSDFVHVIQPILDISYEGITLPQDLIDLIFGSVNITFVLWEAPYPYSYPRYTRKRTQLSIRTMYF